MADEPSEVLVCVPKRLPDDQIVAAAATAAEHYPGNVPFLGAASVAVLGPKPEPQHIAALVTKYWGPSPRVLSVQFLDRPDQATRKKILSHMNAWSKWCCVSFKETTGRGQVRIARQNDGYWSYLGTDILHIPANQPTMNLQSFTARGTPDSEFYRVVRHETGHTLGFPHEHMRRELVDRIDPEKAYEYFQRYDGWDRATVDAQVLTALDERSIMATPADVTSIMCYQLPGGITRDGQAIPGGNDIDQSDADFAAKIYPRPRGRAGKKG